MSLSGWGDGWRCQQTVLDRLFNDQDPRDKRSAGTHRPEDRLAETKLLAPPESGGLLTASSRAREAATDFA